METSNPLNELRREIDAIDDALHDLLMRRAGMTGAIARTKPRTGGRIPLALAMRPAREAAIMRRLAGRHSGDLPLGTVIRVMREILAASLAAQTPFRVHAFGGAPEFTELAHAYFGAGTPVTPHESAARAVHACADDADSIGVVPLAEAGGDTWWMRLAPAGGAGPRVIAKLPFLADHQGPAAYALAAIEQEDTGDDTTILRADVAPSLSRTKLLTQLKDAGIAARAVASGPAAQRGFAPILLEAEGFFANSDARLAAFCAQVGTDAAAIFPVGGFANPLTVKVKELAS